MVLAGCVVVARAQADEFAPLDGLWTGTLESRVGASHIQRRTKNQKKKEKNFRKIMIFLTLFNRIEKI
jgi:hypothetical protein